MLVGFITAKLNNSLKMSKAVKIVQTIVKLFLAVPNFQKQQPAADSGHNLEILFFSSAG